MPGYQKLPSTVFGKVADLMREADACEASGMREQGVALYERALSVVIDEGEGIPTYRCGGLALMHRQSGRYADEVDLLERYQISPRPARDRARIDARLSKARALAPVAQCARHYGMADSPALLRSALLASRPLVMIASYDGSPRNDTVAASCTSGPP